MKSYNHIFITICSSMKVSLCIYQLFMHSFSLTDDVYSLFHLQHCLQSCLSLCQPFSIAMLIIVYTMALILIIIIFIIIRMYFLTNVITMLMIPMQQALSPFQLPCSEYTNVHV